MPLDLDRTARDASPPGLPADFADRLQRSLAEAEGPRRRHQAVGRAVPLLPFLLLIGPIVAWRLLLASADDVQVSISALSWLAFFLDVGVHIDTALLRYLHLQVLPSLVGALLFLLVTLWLLWDGDAQR